MSVKLTMNGLEFQCDTPEEAAVLVKAMTPNTKAVPPLPPKRERNASFSLKLIDFAKSRDGFTFTTTEVVRAMREEYSKFYTSRSALAASVFVTLNRIHEKGGPIVMLTRGIRACGNVLPSSSVWEYRNGNGASKP